MSNSTSNSPPSSGLAQAPNEFSPMLSHASKKQMLDVPLNNFNSPYSNTTNNNTLTNENNNNNNNNNDNLLTITTNGQNVNNKDEIIDASNVVTNNRMLNKLHYTFMLFILTAAGPFGIEALMSSSSPFWAIISLVIVPFAYCIPQSLMCAELSSMIPSNHGSIAWVYRGLGGFCGFLYSFNDCCSTLIDTPTYIVLIGTYSQDWLSNVFGVSKDSTESDLICYFFKALLILSASGLNMFNVSVVGNASVILSIFIVVPLLIGFFIQIPDINPSVWFDSTSVAGCDSGVCNWPLYVSTVIWLHTGWDVVSHVAGEVGFDFSTIMTSFLWANLLDFIGYFIPLITVLTIAYPSSNNYESISSWKDGYLLDAYYKISNILGTTVFFAAIFSNYGLHLCEISTLVREMWALSQNVAPKSVSNIHLDEIPIAVLPSWMGTVWSKTNAPFVAIIICTVINLFFIALPFEFLLELSVVQNCMSFILEYGSLITLRYYEPNEPRPFKIPGGMFGVWSLTILKFALIGLLLVMIVIQEPLIFVICIILNIVVIIYYYFVVRKRNARIIEQYRNESNMRLDDSV